MNYTRFSDFYPYYLAEHQNRICRRLHFIGSLVVIGLLLRALISLNPWYVLGALFAGYGFAWIGHFVFEKNSPATFKYPLYSFAGDWVMFKDILVGKIPF